MFIHDKIRRLYRNNVHIELIYLVKILNHRPVHGIAVLYPHLVDSGEKSHILRRLMVQTVIL